MKFVDVTESVTSINSFKQKKKEQSKQKIDRAKNNAMIEIDHAVARTIDILANELGQTGAQSAVMQHLSDLVMAHDLEGGLYD